MTFVTVSASEAPPVGAELVYEAEWNEEATVQQHADAIGHFARRKALPRPPSNVADELAPDGSVWWVGEVG